MSNERIVGKAGKFNICFRDVNLSSHAGMVLLGEFADAVGVAQVLDDELQVKQRERGYAESEAVLSLTHNLIVGGSCLLDLEVLRGDAGTQALLDLENVLAPMTAGEFLRKFTMGDIHDLYRVHQRLQERVRPHQDATCCTLDVDSSVYEQASTRKEGSRKAYNGEIGYHPLFVFWHEVDELVFSHLRRGNAYTSGKALEYFNRQFCNLLMEIDMHKIRRCHICGRVIFLDTGELIGTSFRDRQPAPHEPYLAAAFEERRALPSADTPRAAYPPQKKRADTHVRPSSVAFRSPSISTGASPPLPSASQP